MWSLYWFSYIYCYLSVSKSISIHLNLVKENDFGP